MPNNGMLLQPRVLAKTVIYKRTIVSLKNGELVIDDDLDEEQKDVNIERKEVTEAQRFYLKFWPELIDELVLDDTSQPMPNSIGKIGNILFPMPPSAGQVWLTVYFLKQRQEVGIFLTFLRGVLSDSLYEALMKDKEEINKELGIEV